MASSGLTSLPLRAIDGLADRVFAVLGAMTMAQVPAFIAHYIQRLGGHLAEAERNVAGWWTIAHNAGCPNLVQLAARYRANGTAEVVAAGNKCLADVQRVEELKASLSAIRDAPAWRRGIEFLSNMDREIVAGTLKNFKPNLPMTLESAAYALLGIVAGLVLYSVLKALLKMLGHAITAASASSGSTNKKPKPSGK